MVEQMGGHDYGSPLRDMTGYLDALAAPVVVPGDQELPPVVLAWGRARSIWPATERRERCPL